MATDDANRLARDGGRPVRTAPFPPRTPFDDRESAKTAEAIRSQNLFGMWGSMLPEFEKRFADAYGAKYSVGSSSGTAAIHIAIGTIDPEPGDEIITAPITDAGSVVPILYQNAIPIFADIDETYNMDPADVEAKITPRTKAILVVHLFGNPCDMEAMVDIARRHDLWLIEDASQAHMTRYKGRLLGTIGDFGCFSFQQCKHMTTGDGGMTITNNDELAGRMKLFRDKGWTRSGVGSRMYDFLAPNYRITELQAAVGLVQLDKVRAVVEKRNRLGDLLSSLIQDVSAVQPVPVTEGGDHSYWLYPLRMKTGNADEFVEALHAEGIPPAIARAHYIGKPIFLCMEALARKATFGASQHPLDGCHGGRRIDYVPGMCPKTEKALDELVIFCIHEHMDEQDIRDIAWAVIKVADGLYGQTP